MHDTGGNVRLSGEKRLNSWKEIAAYLQKDVRTVQRWEKNEGLPVHRKPHTKLPSVYAYESELDEWWNHGRHPIPAPLLTAQATAKDGRLALVVLPLRNLSDDPQQEYFSDGLTEELIAQIGRIDPSQLGVIARASAMKYKQGGKGISQIAKELSVNYALEGSVRRYGERVRISVALIRASDQTSLWTQAYERDLRDILQLQAEVAQTVAKEIAVKVSDRERAGSRGPRALTRKRTARISAAAIYGIDGRRMLCKGQFGVLKRQLHKIRATPWRTRGWRTLTRSSHQFMWVR